MSLAKIFQSKSSNIEGSEDTNDIAGIIHLNYIDLIVLIVYFLFVLGLGFWTSLKVSKNVSGYFLAGRTISWIPVGASLFSSNIGSGHFVGLAGGAAAGGLGTAVFELNALFVVLILAWVFVPVYIASEVFTMPEYIKKRFGGKRIRLVLSLIALVLYIFTKISADLFAGAIFLEQALNWNLYLAVVILLIVSALFTITGGLAAVIYTDTLQTVVMLIGALTLSILSFIKVGGFNAVYEKFFYAIPKTTLYSNSTCGIPPKYSLNIMRDLKSDLPWTGSIFGLTVSAIWYWCSDQVIVQRTLASKNLTHAKGGCILAGYLKILPVFLIIFPGMISRILYPDMVGCADPDDCFRRCGMRHGCSNIAYPQLVLKIMPVGAKGLMTSVMIAALMSSLTSIFNSASTIFTIDIWTRIRKRASETELLIVGRLFVIVLVVISIIWIPVIQGSKGTRLFDYIQSITSFLAPPICAIYVLAVLCPRVNEKGAFWGMIMGLAIGITRFILEYSYPDPSCGSDVDLRPLIVSKIHYLNFGIILFVLSVIFIYSISMMTEPIHEKLNRLTFWTRYSREPLLENIPVNDWKKEDELFDLELENLNTNNDDDHVPWWREYLIVRYCCGIQSEKELRKNKIKARKLSIKSRTNYLYEEPFWKNFVALNALILVLIGVFLWVFFS
ncbi:sodium/mannose cotransporter SLC5A10-like isoform X2 [Gordionus sp. m RMFG-2023]|uniref:sodium/mannose cotransporter SLC5A10-like isoform X2 n=1 Tax=Gordionus sp. m RMFG-2023 TaxID=3053472 RepID=UPI0031FD0415